MKRAGEILASLLHRVATREEPMAWLATVWPNIVGSRLAAHTKPTRLSGDVLEISANAPEWLDQLKPMADEFPRRINAAWCGTLVKEVRIVPAYPEAENDQTPFVRTRGAEQERGRRRR